jgi:RNase P subunit RPR2
MTVNDAGLWYEIRDGQPFCKNCDRPLVGVTVREVGVLDAPVEGIHYHCDGCGKNVILPSPR